MIEKQSTYGTTTKTTIEKINEMKLTKKQFLIFCTIGTTIILISLATGSKLQENSPKKNVGGVVSNGVECPEIGRSILTKGGSAVDAAIATLFCEGIAMPQSMGLGGGFFMVIYEKKSGKVHVLDAREVAPSRAEENMFDHNPLAAVRGGLAAAVPGELRGYWEAHKKFGKLSWNEVIQPAIELCKNGNLVTPFLETMMKTQENTLKNDSVLREVFIDSRTGTTYKSGEKIKRLRLARTLELIAQKGPDVLYQGELTGNFVKDIQNRGGIIHEDDMNNYRAKWREPVVLHMPEGDTLYTMQTPGSGEILVFILNILRGFLDRERIDTPKNLHRIVEAFKFAFGKRSDLGDPDYVSDIQELLANITSSEYAASIREKIRDERTFTDPKYYGANYSIIEDSGTAHISVISPNGDAVSVTSTINLLFGAGFQSDSTGIILNNEMDDFSSPSMANSFEIPPSPSNFIVPGKRPMSSMCPTIVIDKNKNPRLVIGAAGGSKIMTTVAMVILRHIVFGESIREAIDSSRLHHQLIPMNIYFEQGFNSDLIENLKKLGHRVHVSTGHSGFAALTALAVKNGHVEGGFDPRRGGNISYVN